MKKTKYFLILLAVATILTAGIGQAMAYFTTYAEARGDFRIRLGDETNMEESVSTDWQKTLTIANEVGSEPVFVRAKAFYAPSSLTFSYSGEGWSYNEADGYYYYADLVPGTVQSEEPDTPSEGGKTTPLVLTIKGIPEDVVKGDVFNVIVVYESTPVLYKEDGSTYANWDTILNNGKTESTNRQETPNVEEGKGGSEL